MNWDMKSLDELGIVKRGVSKHRPRDAAYLYGGSHPFIQTADVKKSILYITSYNQTYNDAGLAQSKLWESGTLCITIAANIADTAILKIDACFPDSVIGFIPDEDKADARFIKYLFDTLLRKQFKKISQGAAQDNLSQSKLLSLKFPVPKIKIQTQIASILSSYDDLIENNRRRIQLLEESARLLYKEWFVRLRFPGHEHVKIVDGVPEGWENGIIGDLGKIVTGKTPSKKTSENYGCDILFIKIPDMHRNPIIIDTNEYLSNKGAKTQLNKTIPPRSILVSCIGSIGVVAFNAFQAQTNQQINTIIPFKEIFRYWAYFKLKEVKNILEGIGGGSTMLNINKTKFSSIPIIIPPYNLLELFLEFSNPIFDKIENLILTNRNLIQARDLLLPKLMNGEVSVCD